MRLIDADALKEELRNSWIRKAKMPIEADPFLAFAMSDINNAPTIDAGWIPVSERLPREYARYLVCFRSGECYVYWLEDSDWARAMAEDEGIIAWMPLPMPYREDGEG